MGSPAFEISVDELKKVGTGALFAVGQALIAYLVAVGPTFDQSTIGGLVAGVATAIVVNFLRKYLPNTK